MGGVSSHLWAEERGEQDQDTAVKVEDHGSTVDRASETQKALALHFGYCFGPHSVKVDHSHIHGHGVIATEDIAKGADILIERSVPQDNILIAITKKDLVEFSKGVKDAPIEDIDDLYAWPGECIPDMGERMFPEEAFRVCKGDRLFFVGRWLNHSPTPTAYVLRSIPSDPDLRRIASQDGVEGEAYAHSENSSEPDLRRTLWMDGVEREVFVCPQNRSEQDLRLVASQDIGKGKEVTISYCCGNPWRDWGEDMSFQCNCHRCCYLNDPRQSGCLCDNC